MSIPKYPAAWCQNNPQRAAQLIQQQEETIQRLYAQRLDSVNRQDVEKAAAVVGVLYDLQSQVADHATATVIGAIQQKRERFARILAGGRS